MAIELERTAQLWGITGNLGGGKSLTAVWFAVRAIQSGYFVVSNITLRESSLRRYVGDYAVNLYQHVSLDDPTFDPFKLPCGSPRGRGGDKRVLVIFDECAEWIDQYSSAKDPRISRFWSWLRHTSKRSQDVFIIVQRPDYLNKVVRILISRWIMVADLQTYRLPVLRCRFPFMGGYVMRNVYDRSGVRIGGVSFISKSRWGLFYDTAECLNSEGAQYNVEYFRPRFKRRQPLFFVLVYVFSFIMLFNSVRRLIGASHRVGAGEIVNSLSTEYQGASKKNFSLKNSRSSSNGGAVFFDAPVIFSVDKLFAIFPAVGGFAPRGSSILHLCPFAARCSPASAARHLGFVNLFKPRGARHLGLFNNTTLCTQGTITCS